MRIDQATFVAGFGLANEATSGSELHGVNIEQPMGAHDLAAMRCVASVGRPCPPLSRKASS